MGLFFFPPAAFSEGSILLNSRRVSRVVWENVTFDAGLSTNKHRPIAGSGRYMLDAGDCSAHLFLGGASKMCFPIYHTFKNKKSTVHFHRFVRFKQHEFLSWKPTVRRATCRWSEARRVDEVLVHFAGVWWDPGVDFRDTFST